MGTELQLTDDVNKDPYGSLKATNRRGKGGEQPLGEFQPARLLLGPHIQVQSSCVMWTRNTARLFRATTNFSMPRHSDAAALIEPPRRNCFYNSPPHLPPDDSNILTPFISGFNQLKIEWGRFIQEWKEYIHLDVPKYYLGDIVPLFRFHNKESMDFFQVITDSDFNQGYSRAEFTPTLTGTAVFKGVLDTQVPKDGRTKYAGLAMIQSFPKTISFQRRAYYEWDHWTHLVIRCRGDGRSYTVNLSAFGDFDVQWNIVYQYPLYTRGGPYWQLTYIPFSKFLVVNKGRIQDKQNRISLMHIRKIGIACGDNNPGPFELEIDFIGGAILDAQPEDFAYENYETPNCYALGY
ncbi:putative complex I intermediate-associated protein 30 [Tropilaelaps mercedesae]|uniref:Putative complex I intermediate-associated protein 30 n=1 Tax=Tropilaelaps mercedesae TaxID=418985 RepID=A0A1V9XAW9_9ACAR|nr:putative complex I intermediate-associated protein 30 [Tropilaelaps mercedesae]